MVSPEHKVYAALRPDRTLQSSNGIIYLSGQSQSISSSNSIMSFGLYCPIPGDYPICDNNVTMEELTAYIDEWYACSACVPDIFNALQAYFGIPFCGDLKCNATVGEDCSTCPGDCGSCVPQFPQDYVAYWKFDSEIGGITPGERGVNDGTLIDNAIIVSDAERDNVLSLDGAGDYVSVTDDDSLDVVGIHGVGGVMGLLATGFLASTTVNPGGANGLIFGNPPQLSIQCIAIVVTIVYTFVVTYILLKVVDKIFGLRLPENDEINGLDLSEHDESAYNF